MSQTPTLFERIKPDLIDIFELPADEPLQPETLLVDLGLDSLKAAEICSLLEYSYDSIIPIEKFLENLTVQQLIDHIGEATSAAAPEIAAAG